MGKPKDSVIHDFKSKLEWFSLERYDRLDQLDALGWYRQIQVRRSLLQRLTDDFPRYVDRELKFPRIWPDAKWFLSIIEQNPIVDFEEYPELEFDIPYLRTPVHSTTVEEFYLAEISANESRTVKARRFFDKAREYKHEAWRDGVRLDFHGRAAKVASLIDSELALAADTAECEVLDHGLEGEAPGFNGELTHADDTAEWDIPHDAFEHEHFDGDFSVSRSGETPLHDFLGLNDIAVLSIDLRVPTPVLAEYFKSLVDQLKSDQHKIRAPKLNPADWIRCGLIPYIDLEIWTLTDAFPKYGKEVERIPDPLIRDLILKEDESEDSRFTSLEHTISKVTRSYFNEMCVQQSSLYALLENEAAAHAHRTGIPSRLQRYELRRRRGERKRKNKIANFPEQI